ncbi:hypothetical protein ACYATO_08730 [Lactobacillaceae bacterium Melli_B3]
MYVNANIFNDVKYYSADDSYAISNDSGVLDGYSNYEIIEQLIRDERPMDPIDTIEAYEVDLLAEMESYPMLGFIQRDSLLHDAISLYQDHYHVQLIHALAPDDTDNYDYYFLTRDTNYDVIDIDLFHGDGSGKAKQCFIDFINFSEN